MKFTLRVSPFAPLPEVVEFTRRVDAAGIDGVGFLDSQMINRDLFVSLAAAATATQRLRLVSAVTNPVTRHPSVLASAAASLDDLAPGRVELWLGRGFSAVNLAGLPAATTRELGRATTQVRRLLAGEWDVFPGSHSRMRSAPRSVAVYLAAAGPRTLETAGRVADGVLLTGGLVWNNLERSRELVRRGALAAGREPGEVGECLSLLTCIRQTREEALRWAGPLLVLRLNEPDWLREAGIEARGVQTPAGLSALYPDPMHAEDHEAAMDLAEQTPLELRLQLAEKAGLIGTPEDCVERLREVAAHGIDYVFLRTVDTLSFPEPEVELFPSIRQAVAPS